MLRAFAVLGIIFAGFTSAQWRRFGDAPEEKPKQGSISSNMLAAHNQVRARLGVPPLAWSRKLAGSAQEWANFLLNQQDIFHRERPMYGENLYRIDGGTVTPGQAVQAWASEAKYYDRRTNSCRGGRCGHYTQIVWRDTKAVGCAVARKSGTEVWVCEYYPPGNIVGEKPY